MWVPKWYFEETIRQQNDLERRVKRIELIVLNQAEMAVSSLQSKKAGTVTADGISTIEEIIDQRINTP